MTTSVKTHWSQLAFVAVDVEGSGHNPHEIIELAVVPIRLSSIHLDEAKQWLICPTKPVTPQATAIHGITNEDLAGQPTFAELTPRIKDALGQEILIGHYVQVDQQLIQAQLPQWRPALSLDTIKLAKAVAPNLQSYSLAALITEFGITNLPSGQPHRAMFDAIAAGRLFLVLAQRLDQDGCLTLGKLAELGANSNNHFFSDAQGGLF
ncbi:DNA polymerase III epsilon subunit-like protein [Herbaspirillum sp. 1173]|uniref:3'-5' exonuclease n=1 Tax=Herbaspirillum sp. 1173 TaxID=2817734 RepID=UPI00285CDC17|nr:3'-5' exonuclease [Herbaspirillum sp. 1173]MDR6739788.1 DNA polymerase III epsilon subunit-like protein [Herbaspirillum sp. 1173]